MITNTVQNLINKLPPDTKLVNFVYNESEEEDKEGEELGVGISISDITDVVQNDNLAVNIILNCFLACFGVDVASIARTAVEVTDYRIIDARNLLLNGYWKNTNITINNVTKKAFDWVKELFSIYTVEDFVDTIFRNLTDIMLNSDGDAEYTIIKVDDLTYQMIKFIAFCYGANVNFTSFPLGDTSTTTVDFDGWHLWDMLDGVGEIMEAMGLIADKTQVVHNTAIASWFGSHWLDTSDPNDPVFTSEVQCNLIIHKYPNAHIGYGNSQYMSSYTGTFPYGEGEEVWYYELFITQKSIGTIGKIEYGTSSQGNAQNAGNTYGQTGNNSWYYPIRYSGITFYNTENIVINANVEGCWILRDPRYYVMGYTGNILHQTTNYPYAGFHIANDELQFIRHPSNEALYEVTPYPYYSTYVSSSDYTLAETEVETPILGNSGSVVVETVVPAPNTDNTILGDLSRIDMIAREGFRVIWVGKQALLETLLERSNFINTTVSLKTEMIYTDDAISIRDGKPKYEIDEDLNLDYANCSDMKIKTFYNAKPLLDPPFVYFACIDDDNLKAVGNQLWGKSLWQKIRDDGITIQPFDCLEKVASLPFDLIAGKDYYKEEADLALGGYTLPYDITRNIHVHGLKSGIKVITTYPVLIGVNKSTNPYDTATELDANNSKYKSKTPPSYLDYEPYTTASIYIPFVGERDLPMSRIMRHNVYLEYIVYIPTGDFVATVYAYKYNASLAPMTGGAYGYTSDEDRDKEKAYPILTATGNMAYNHKFMGKDYTNALGFISESIKSLMSLGTSGKHETPVVNTSGLMEGLNQAVHGKGLIHSGSSYNNVCQYMTNMLPYITLFHHEAISGYGIGKNSAFNQTIGLRSEVGVKIKHMDKGFHKVKGAKLDGIKCTMEEQKMIEQILSEGFYKASKKGSMTEE